MFAAVFAGAPGMVHLITGEGEGAFHRLVGPPPITAVLVVVIGAVLEKNADGLGLEFTDKGGIKRTSA